MALLLDLVVVLLLVASLALGLRLQRRLRGLRHDGGEFGELVESLGATVDRAEAVLGELKRASLDHAGRTDDAHRRGAQLRDDLDMLSERANREADRLADLIGEVRGMARERPLARSAAANGAAADGADVGAPSPPARPDDRDALERTLRTLR